MAFASTSEDYQLESRLNPSALEHLGHIADQLARGEKPSRVTVRQFLQWFGVYRRGFYKVIAIREALKAVGLVTEPDFQSTYIDSEISFELAEGPAQFAISSSQPPSSVCSGDGSPSEVTLEQDLNSSTVLGGGVADPTYRIGRFAAANNPPVFVKPDSLLAEAVTLMLSHGFSQLPVMQNERVVKGVISWASIGARLALGLDGGAASSFMEPPHEVSADASFFAAIPAIIENQYVLVRGSENKITGIVTTTDLSLEFQRLAEPFLLLGEIENHICRLIDGKYTLDDVKAATDPADDAAVESVTDLTFGSYVRLLEKPVNWAKLALAVDQTVFVRELDLVRRIRNDVMHFDPDPLEEEDLVTLRRFLRLLQTLQDVGAT